MKAKRQITTVLCLFLASSAALSADTIRVTTWNLRSEVKAARSANQITAAAETLKTLDPDVILLQNIRDWEFCNQLAQALKPADYNVLVCSGFGAGATNPAQTQVAVLAKAKGYFSWSESFATPDSSSGGYAFAALQFGGERLGFFSAQINNPIQVAQAAQQVSKQAAAVRNWTMNRVQALFVGASFDTKPNELSATSEQSLRLLRQAGFVDGLGRLPAEQRITLKRGGTPQGLAADCLYLEPSTFAGNVRVVSSAAFEHQPLTCDLELDPTKAAAAWVSSAMETASAQRPVASVSQGDLSVSDAKSWTRWWVALIGGAAVATVVLLLLTRRRPHLPPPPAHALLPNSFEPGQQTPPSSFTVVLAPQSATGVRPGPGTTQTQSAVWQQRALAAEQRAEQAHAVIRKGLLPHLSEWLKHFLFRKLIADRERLLEAQQTATRKALVVDERLARIEQQIKEQNLSYTRRIEELVCELASAKEENRELIRQRIAQVRAEMEAARTKLMAEAEERQGGDSGKEPAGL